MAFAPDGQRLATASYDGRVGMFPLTGGEGEFFQAHEGRVMSLQFSADGQQLLTSGSDDMTLRLWNLATTPPSPALAPLKSQDMLMWATLSPDGRRAAAVGRGSNVTVYPLDTGGPPLRLVGHEQTVFRAIFSPDGRQLATVGGDMTVRLWDLDPALSGAEGSGKELFKLRLPTQIQNNQAPLWDFDFRCTPDQKACWIAVPLTVGKLALYRVRYSEP